MSSKVALIIFILLLGLIVGELYFAFLPSKKSSNSSTSITLTATLKKSTLLYGGPDDKYFVNPLPALIPEGTKVAVIGEYTDFAKVQVNIDGSDKIGYIAKTSLKEIPQGIPILRSEQVPWETVRNITNLIKPKNSTVLNNVVTIKNDNSTVTLTADKKLPTYPIYGFKFNFNQSGIANLRISGRLRESSESVWWKNILRMEVSLENKAYVLRIYDGKSEKSAMHIDLKGIAPNKEFSILFLDKTGKEFVVLNDKAKQVTKVNLTLVKGLNMPNGLFPFGEVYAGYMLAPRSQLILSQFILRQPPSGKYAPSK